MVFLCSMFLCEFIKYFKTHPYQHFQKRTYFTAGRKQMIILQSLILSKFIILQMNQSASTMTGKTKLKVVFLGNQSVGKSCIIQRYIKNIFQETANPTVGIDFLVKNIVHRNKSYRLQLWDTAGQQRFRALIPNYLKDAKCALIIIDVSNKSSLNSVEMWMELFNDNKKGDGFSFTVLIGNKTDLEYRQITQEEALKKAQELKIPYFQVSAKTGANVDELFEKVIDVFQKKNVSAGNFELKETNNMIVEQEGAVEEQTQIKQEKTKQVETQLVEKGEQKKQEQVKGTVVLKNEKIDEKKLKKKEKCC